MALAIGQSKRHLAERLGSAVLFSVLCFPPLALGQTVTPLTPGQQMTVTCSGLAPSGTPTAQPTPTMDPNAITNITHLPSPQNLNSPPSQVYPAWTVDSNVASVTVTDNGIPEPNPNPVIPSGLPTAIYRAGGVPTGLCNACGYLFFTATGGTHDMIFTAVNDAGQVIDRTSKVVSVMP
jgi:hypothetical protein